MARLGVRPRVIALMAIAALALPVAVAGPAAAKPKGDPVKVMVIYEASEGIPNPEIPDGAVAAAQAMNKKDGIGGAPVEVIICDTHNDPNTAAECGRQAVDEGVVAVIGSLTVHASSFMDLLAENKIPSIGIVLAGIAEFQGASSFPVSGGIVATAADLPRFLYDDGARAISVARPDLAAGAALKTFGDISLEKVGSAMVNDVGVPIDAPDMSTYVEAALAGGTDAIIVALPGQQALNFVQAAKQADPTVKLALISTEQATVVEALGKDVAGIIQAPTTLPPTIIKTKEGKRFLKEIKKAGFDESGGFRLNSWIAMQVLATIAADLDEVTAAAVFDALNVTEGLETGLTPPLQWTTPADLGSLSALAPRVFNACEVALKFTKSGKVKPVTGNFFDALTGEDCETPS
ncbi:MAG: hypothetical protein EXQ79_01580 [Acidimicrobiia bacterium]|nr:hypothetical protein [Acidimicrobiia bacterium]